MSMGLGVGHFEPSDRIRNLPTGYLAGGLSVCHFLSGDGFLKSWLLSRSVPPLSVLESHSLRIFNETEQWSASFNIVLIYEVGQCYSRFI